MRITPFPAWLNRIPASVHAILPDALQAAQIVTAAPPVTAIRLNARD
jgi:hypothetical protein